MTLRYVNVKNLQLTWLDMAGNNNLAKLSTINQNTNMTMQWCTFKTHCIQALAKRLEWHVTKVPQKPVLKDNGKVKKKRKLEAQSQDQSFFPQALSKNFHK